MGLECDFSKLISKFEEMEKKASGQLIDKALDKGADVMLKAQKSTVPKDTGALESSLDKGSKGGSGGSRSITIGIENGDKDTLRYGYYQEHGTSYMVGKKWMKKAFENSKSDANKAISETIKEELLG